MNPKNIYKDVKGLINLLLTIGGSIIGLIWWGIIFWFIGVGLILYFIFVKPIFWVGSLISKKDLTNYI